MNIRKIFNKPNAAQKILLINDMQNIDAEIEKLIAISWKKEDDKKKLVNGRCPHCSANDIINKIAHVQKSGGVSGDFTFGIGNMYDSSKIDTSSVNHCVKCGNQWKRYKGNVKYSYDHLKNWANHLRYYGEDIKNKKNIWIDDVKKLQDMGFHAEPLYERLRIHLSYGYRLKFLRKLFPSIYDAKII